MQTSIIDLQEEKKFSIQNRYTYIVCKPLLCQCFNIKPKFIYFFNAFYDLFPMNNLTMHCANVVDVYKIDVIKTNFVDSALRSVL